MKLKKQFIASICFALAVIIMLSVPVPVFSIDENGFYTKLEEFKKTRYGNGSTYLDNPSLTGGYQCFGFANELAIFMFGSYPTSSMSAVNINSGWTRTYGGSAVDNLSVGDIVRFYYHSIFITGISGDTIYYCQANVPSGTNRVTYDNSISRSDLKSKVSAKLTSGSTDKTGWVAHCTSGLSPYKPVTCTCNSSYAGTYRCTTSSASLTIRAGHGTSYSAIGSIPSGANVNVTKADGSWAHVEYNGISGYASMQYLQLISSPVSSALTVDNRYPTPIKMYALSTNQKAANAYFSYEDMQKAPATDKTYVYNTDYVTIKEVYVNQAVKLNCEFYGTYQDAYSYGTQFFINMGVAPTKQTAERNITTYTRPGGDKWGEIYVGDNILILGTSGNYTQVIYPHDDGTYRCMWCLSSDLIHTHTPGPAATCTAPQVCTTCDEILANAKGHNFNQKNTSSDFLKSSATCTAAAVYYYSCSCGEIGTSTFTSGSPIAHTYNQKNTSSTYLKSSATCTSPAVYYYSCSCGAKGTTTFTVGEALGHSWNNGVVTKEATYSEMGVKTYTCTRCGATKKEDIPKIPSIPVTGVLLNQTSANLNIGGTLSLTATVSPSSATNKAVTWTSSNSSVASVSGNGVVTAKAGGTAIITVTTTDGGKTATCKVTVTPARALGDINGDGEIDAADAGLISRYDAGFITLTAEQLSAGDVNKDGEVDAADAGLISRYDAGFISSLKN